MSDAAPVDATVHDTVSEPVSVTTPSEASPITFNVTLRLSPVRGGDGGATPLAAAVQFTPLRRLGGGEGRHPVFLGLDHQLDTELAYKQIPKSSLNLDQYHAEAQRLHAGRHRHVVPVQYACEDSDHLFIAMPCFVRGSLQSLLETRMLTVREIIRLGLEFLMGLHHAHVRGVAHLDIKPSNVLLDDSGAALLADFGQSCLVDAKGFAVQPELYPTHWPPEVMVTNKLTRQSDVYQAGLTLYRMCVGESEWRRQLAALGGNRTEKFVDAVKLGRFPLRDVFPAHIPISLRRVVQRALKVDPDERWSTVLALLTALAGVNEDEIDWVPTETAEGGMRWTLTPEDGSVPRQFDLTHNGTGQWNAEGVRLGKRRTRVTAECLGPVSAAAARAHAYRVLMRID